MRPFLPGSALSACEMISPACEQANAPTICIDFSLLSRSLASFVQERQDKLLELPLSLDLGPVPGLAEDVHPCVRDRSQHQQADVERAHPVVLAPHQERGAADSIQFRKQVLLLEQVP